MTIRLREYVNPYDFANPVGEERLFFGRTTEIADITYYLNHAQRTNRPIHLAFVGSRASGKTSFLNITELEAKRRNFCTVRINLNEGDVETDLDFFRKLFHSIAMASFASGAFGGKGGRFHLAYLDLIATNNTTNIESIPFLFAFQVSRALSAGNKSMHVPDDILSDDLKLISSETNKQIILLFDECNVLRTNRMILEKLRNIFMNMTGYMLVFAATDDFFPVMDEVFSPIMRQFKRIDIGPFKSQSDVRDCILMPLRHIGLKRGDARHLVPGMFIQDVDTLSGRRPYEVQLICHSLFRRCQESGASRFSLDLKTIQSIQREIASGQNIDQRPAIQAARHLDRKTLSLLDTVGLSTNPGNTKLWWALEYIFHDTNRWSESLFSEGVQKLISAGILRDENDTLEFAGDELDRLYIKYLARQKQITINSTPQEFFVIVFHKAAEHFKNFESLRILGGFEIVDRSDDLRDTVDFLSQPDKKSLSESPWCEDLIEDLITIGEGSEIALFDFFFSTPQGNFQMWLLWKEPEQSSTLKKFSNQCERVQERCSQVGFSLTTRRYNLTVPTTATLVDKIRNGTSENVATRIAGRLMKAVGNVYVDDKDKVRAKFLGDTAFAIIGNRLTAQANDMGYLSMAFGEFDEAKLWFQAAEQYDLEKSDLQLLAYNFGVADALTGDFEAALAHFKRAKLEPEGDIACVFKLHIEDGDLKHEEIFEPHSMTALIDEAVEVVEKMISSNAGY